MKKLICLILAAAILILPTACGNTSETDIITEPGNETVDFGETEDLAAQYKEFFLKSLDVIGGAGYKEEPEQIDRLTFTGDKIRLNVRLANDRFACDYGVYVIVNGVFQSFAVLDAQGKPSDYACMQTFDLKENETLETTFAFTPNTGKKGEELPLMLCYISQPSFETEYTDSYGRYGHYYEHAYRPGANCILKMEADVPNTMPPAAVPTQSLDIPDYYYFEDKDRPVERWELFSDEVQVKTDGRPMLLTLKREAKSQLYFDTVGYDGKFRVTLFINHVPVTFADGSSCAEFEAKKDQLTRVTLPVDTASLPENSHSYLFICGTGMANPYLPEGTFDLYTKLGTYYLVIS